MPQEKTGNRTVIPRTNLALVQGLSEHVEFEHDRQKWIQVASTRKLQADMMMLKER